MIGSGLGGKLLAQDYHLDIRQLGVKEGLLHREVNVIHQDRSGFLWFATPLGLNRYDGYRFKHFTRKTHLLQTNRFDLISEDQDGRLWLFGVDSKIHSGRIASLDILSPKTDKVSSFESQFPDNSLFTLQDLRAICLTGPSGELIFQHADSLHLIFYDTQKGFRKLKLPDFPGFQLRFTTPHGTLWGKSDNNNWIEIGWDGTLIQEVLFAHHTYTTSVPEVSEDGFFLYMHEPVIAAIFVDWKGNKTIIKDPTWHDQEMLMPVIQFVSFLLQNKAKKDDYQMPGVEILQELEAYFLEREGIHFRDYCQSNDGGLWLAGNFGVYQILVRPNPFTNMLANPYGESNRSSNIACRGLWTDGDRLIINQEPDTSKLIWLETGEQKNLDKGNCNSWANKAVAQLSNGDFLMGTASCLLQVNESFQVEKSWPKAKEVRAIFEETPNRIWLGMGLDKGICWLDLIEDKVQTFPTGEKLTFLQGNSIGYIAPDQANRIWICTDDGFFRFVPEDSSFVYYGSQAEGENYLPAEGFKHFVQDESGIFWLATAGAGLIRWDQEQDSILHFMREDGLPNNTLYAVYEDKHNNLWIPSDYGIIQFDKQSHSSRTYLPEDGTSEVEFNSISHTKGPDGRLFFGSLNGITSFHPKDFYANNKTDTTGPALRMTGFSQFDVTQNRLVDKSSEVMLTKTITLNPDDRYFRIEMAMLEYGDNSLTQYLWRIEDWEDQWQVQNGPSIQLSRLPYGTYQMHIRARTARGEYSENDLRLTIKVVTPFYLTPTFILLMVLGFLLVAGITVYLRIRNLRKIQETLEQKVAEATAELREMDHLKTRLFANVSHELRTPLSLILGPISTVLRRNKIEKKDADYLKLARESSQSLQRLITEILDLGKLESGKLQLNETAINFSAFLQKKTASFKAVAENKGLAFDFNSDLPENTYLYFDRQMVEKVVNNLLSNAIKFTPEGGTVSLQCSVGSMPSKNETLPTANSLLLTVSDTGKGIHPDDLPFIFDRYYQAQKGDEQLTGGTGIGLALSKELTELMGGSLETTSEWKNGSTFTLFLPMKEEQVIEEEGVSVFAKKEAQVVPLIETMVHAVPVSKPDREITILVTEDNPDLRDYLQSLLEPAYQVVTARHGREALQILEQSISLEATPHIDLIITDLMMPEMDGFTLLNHIKKHASFSNIPVVMLTARTGIHDKLQALLLGVHDYLTKPFEENELLIRIENLLTWAQVRTLEEDEEEEKESSTFSQKEVWLKDVDSWVGKHFQSSEIRMLDWAVSLNLSESQFRRKIKQASGLTPQQYLQEYRLKTAQVILENQEMSTVAEVAFEVGFSAADYFSKVFHKRFGKLPSQYLAA